MPSRRLAALLFSLLAVPVASFGAPHEATNAAHTPVKKRPVATQRRLPLPPIPPAPPQQQAQGAAPAKPERDPNKGSVTGLPVPRYASLRADVVNLRAGPGARYPIDWVYRRVGMPVEILREFDVWRLVETPDGEKGWMHEATLTGRRDFYIASQPVTLRADPQVDARAVALLQPGVIGRIRSCDATAAWCRAQVNGYSGWLQRSVMWGTLPDEAIKP